MGNEAALSVPTGLAIRRCLKQPNFVRCGDAVKCHKPFSAVNLS